MQEILENNNKQDIQEQSFYLKNKLNKFHTNNSIKNIDDNNLSENKKDINLDNIEDKEIKEKLKFEPKFLKNSSKKELTVENNKIIDTADNIIDYKKLYEEEKNRRSDNQNALLNKSRQYKNVLRAINDIDIKYNDDYQTNEELISYTKNHIIDFLKNNNNFEDDITNDNPELQETPEQQQLKQKLQQKVEIYTEDYPDKQYNKIIPEIFNYIYSHSNTLDIEQFEADWQTMVKEYPQMLKPYFDDLINIYNPIIKNGGWNEYIKHQGSEINQYKKEVTKLQQKYQEAEEKIKKLTTELDQTTKKAYIINNNLTNNDNFNKELNHFAKSKLSRKGFI